MNKEQDKAVTYIKHDCNDFRHIVYTNTEHYTLAINKTFFAPIFSGQDNLLLLLNIKT